MDELLKNYIKHIQVNFSPELAGELDEILSKGLQNEIPIEDIEKTLQNRLCDYLRNLKSNEFEKTAKSLYEAYVDYDDENLIRSVRFLIRIYSKFLNLKLARFFCDWRIKTMQIANKQQYNKLDFDIKTENMNNLNRRENNIEEFGFTNDERQEEIYYNKNKINRIIRGKNELENIYNKNTAFNYDDPQKTELRNNNKFDSYENKLNYNYNYDPSTFHIDKIHNNSPHIDKSYKNITIRGYEDRFSKLNKIGNEDFHNYNTNSHQNGLKPQRNDRNYDSEEENKTTLKSQKRKEELKKGNNSSFDKKNTSQTTNGNVSPSNRRKNINSDFNRQTNNVTRMMNNIEEKRTQMKTEKQKKEKNNSNSMTIFDKLFLESYKKSDEKLLNEEIKKLSELDECTFQPNVNNKRGIL